MSGPRPCYPCRRLEEMTETYWREIWLFLRHLPIWKRVGFWAFNVGGISYASVAPFLEAYRGAGVWWLYLLWVSVLSFAVCTALDAGRHVWEKVAADRDRVAARLVPKLAFRFDPACCAVLAASSWAGLMDYHVRLGV